MPLLNLKKLLHIRLEEHEKETYTEIEEGVFFRGHNLWLLVLSMGIACVGLNINSPAAVIGAMLISPLMGPVVGLAFGLSIQSKRLVKLSLWNWGIMIFTGLIASTLFFLISPFHSETTQLAAFKEATVFDCFLALFGGFAWFIGITKKEAIKVIAGVAVATACIPPLCTAGYGLANLNAEYFFGGLYFYIVNCMYIGLGTWILSVLMGYQNFYVTKQVQNGASNTKKMSFYLGVLSLIILVPSLFFTIEKWKEEYLQHEAKVYIEKIQKKNPEIAIIGHKVFEENGKKFLDISILNDSNFISKQQLYEHDLLNKDIHLIWHYSKSTTNNQSEIKQLQIQVNELRDQLNKYKTVRK